eukprot:TRINITY_DN296_c0_g1_i1.p1 TRINITY_DN296_c0_g1~~TRINITY_DN296_c0_g1_i1.p1  ORF type:complete len:564 (+),score=175.24 TRINITY_DN296_c0_g1_i1:90-1694(+)
MPGARRTVPGGTHSVDHRQWIRNHPLEGDGLLTGFYNHMWKKNKEFKSCDDVLCPDTIVYDHNFPRSWYTYDRKNRELVKKQGKVLDTSTIAAAFSKQEHQDVGIVASYMFSCEDPDTGEPVTSVEFFNAQGLHEFVNRKIKKEGILQRFLVPKGARNSVIQAVWSPRVCIVQRKTNVRPLHDRAESTRDPYSCAVTYEGPSHFSEDGTCAAKTTAKVKQICFNIVDHFYNTEHKHITRMVLYFKVDKDDLVWLLWCGSVRVSDRQQPSKMPLNLAPIFTSPTAQRPPRGGRDVGRSAPVSDAQLTELDLSHCKLRGDPMFYNRYVASPRTPSPRGHSRKQQGARAGDDGDKRGDDQAMGGTAEERRAAQQAAQSSEESWYKLAGIEESYHQLCAEREMVSTAFGDVFYEAYSHHLKHDAGPHVFTIDRKIAQVFSLDAVQELMVHLKIDHAQPPDDLPAGAEWDEELSFIIPSGGHSAPISKLGENAAQWIAAHYAKLEQRLREEAAQARKAMLHEQSEGIEAVDSGGDAAQE